MSMRFNPIARVVFESSGAGTKQAASPVLRFLSNGFELTWFIEIKPLVWAALARPDSALADQFGIRQECLVIGNGYESDFHQSTLAFSPPEGIAERFEPSIRIVASVAPYAEASCTAWAARHKVGVVHIGRRSLDCSDGAKELYAVLTRSLWRRDLFAETEPVRLPSEFFGRERYVSEVLGKVMRGQPLGVFGLRKIGKSSLLNRVQDLLSQSQDLNVIASILGNATAIRSGRWWDVLRSVLHSWKQALEELAKRRGSKVRPGKLQFPELIEQKVADTIRLAQRFERDFNNLRDAALALLEGTEHHDVRFIMVVDECDYLYPQATMQSYWRDDFLTLWNTLQSVKRSQPDPACLVYLLGGVNPMGLEQGTISGQPNPLFETQRVYLTPMSGTEAGELLNGLGSRMGLRFSDAAVLQAYSLVGGHPLLLRKIGSAVHLHLAERHESREVTREMVDRVFKKVRRDLCSHAVWILEHLKAVAPDEERLLRDIATSGPQAFVSVWGDHDYRETFAHHLEQYGLIQFVDDSPEIQLPLIVEALKRPLPSAFDEQRNQLAGLVDMTESAIRSRIAADLARDRSEAEAIEAIVNVIPNDPKNRGMNRRGLLDLGDAAGVTAVLEALNWGDYLTLLNRYYDQIQWAGEAVERSARLEVLSAAITDFHVVRHNNATRLRELISQHGFTELWARLSIVREWVGS